MLLAIALKSIKCSLACGAAAVLLIAPLATSSALFRLTPSEPVLGGPSGAGVPDEPARAFPASLSADVRPLRYGRDVRPILSDRCFKCHGPDARTRQADLRLDERDSAVRVGKRGAAIVPGRPDDSLLWHHISSTDPDRIMPPPDSNKRPLSPEEQAVIRRWIEQGAPYEPHWSFVPPVRPRRPAVRAETWCRNEIDRFVLAMLEEQDIEPSPPADRETLLRRVFLDLTGLPPTPEETDAFLADARPDAYDRWVDTLLTQEPYRTRHAEHMAGPWLDAARYADTCGIHTDAGRQIWPWRDWVLRAYRQNMPFDRFLIEQLAGDLLPDATRDQKVATGFNRNHVTTDEGGAIPEEYLVEYAVDRTATVGSVFLGLTLACARCHEHKFDPISQEEFYGLYAFFNSIDEPGLYSQLPDANRAFEPFIQVPTAEQEARLNRLRDDLTAARSELDQSSPEEAAQFAAFLDESPKRAGVRWARADLVRAVSTGGATLTAQPDGSVLASGANPKQDDFVITLRTSDTDLRLLMIEAMTDPSLPMGRVGRAFNGNAVLTGVKAEAVSTTDPSRRRTIRFVWAWADHEQADGDHTAVNLLDTTDDLGWAVDAHRRADGRVALLLADQPFGFDGGTELIVNLEHRSIYDQHTLGRVRLTPGRIGDEGLSLLPMAMSGWYVVGPFPIRDRDTAFDTVIGPEQDAALDLKRNFGSGNQFWRYDYNLRDEQLNPLVDGVNLTYVARRIFSPTDRMIDVFLGSDDGIRVFLDGAEAFSNKVERGLAADQDRASLRIPPGGHVLTLKIVNTGGAAGFYYRSIPREGELTRDLVAALIPESVRDENLRTRLAQAWKTNFSPGYRQKKEHIADLEKQLAELDAAVPKTMVMRELPAARETFVLTRGQYDKPDKARPVTRGIPAALGRWPDGAPLNRLGLAQWLIAPDNPLVARVAVNRLWEMFFGTGIVRTSEDFGLQGEWPSHPELLDWLAVEFREKGWDVQHMIRLIVSSSTYRQSSRVRPDLHERDPDNRWLAYFPRRRLTAEQVRDQALYVSGLLVEKFGGPSVKPYQPDGLWQEVSMPQSNTREFVQGRGDELWRRSLYTYWKRACPPPGLMNFDAPTRESCTIRRASTNTPLQALTLWNDVQYVEAARALAARTLTESRDDVARLVQMFRRCTGRTPDDVETRRLVEALAEFRKRYTDAPEDAAALLGIGEYAAPASIAAAELAAWTMIANALLNLSAVLTQG